MSAGGAVDGRSQLGPMSRKMKAKEVKAFELAHGYKPTAVRVAIDALAVFVHKDNPIEGLSVAQVDAIFSEDRKCGHSESVTSWGQVGVDGGENITAFGRDAASGTRAYFAKKALCKGKFKSDVAAINSSSEIVERVAGDANGIGYSGMGYATDGVRAVPIAKRDGGDFVEATPENASSGKYPLGRFLYIYVNKKPDAPLPEAVSEFIKWVLSPTGQTIVADAGFIALPQRTVDKELKVASR